MKLCSIKILFLFSALLLSACGTQIQSVVQHTTVSLSAGDLKRDGLAFITPTTPTGMEEDKQYLALTFSQQLKKEFPDVAIFNLPETLGVINQNGFSETYFKMYDQYIITGLFTHDILQEIGTMTGKRYLGQLKLANFENTTQGRWGILGLRVVDTRSASIRLVFQIWDSKTGKIAWEGTQELNYATETISESPVTFELVIRRTATNLAKLLPKISPNVKIRFVNPASDEDLAKDNNESEEDF